MRNILVLLIALAVTLPTSMFAQDNPAKQWFENGPEAFTPEQVIARLNRSGSMKSGGGVAQVRDEKIFVIVASDHFVRKGRSLQMQLATIRDWNEPLTIFGRILPAACAVFFCFYGQNQIR